MIWRQEESKMAELQEVQSRHSDAQLSELSKALNDRLWPAVEATRNKRDCRVNLAAKALASHMARVAVRSMNNRRERATQKAEIYAQLTTVLENACLRERKLQRVYTTTVLFLCGFFAIVLTAVLLVR